MRPRSSVSALTESSRGSGVLQQHQRKYHSFRSALRSLSLYVSAHRGFLTIVHSIHIHARTHSLTHFVSLYAAALAAERTQTSATELPTSSDDDDDDVVVCASRAAAFVRTDFRSVTSVVSK